MVGSNVTVYYIRCSEKEKEKNEKNEKDGVPFVLYHLIHCPLHE